MSSHLVFGAGLIGCFLGTVLTHQGVNTRLFCRASVASRLSKGVKLTDYEGNEVDSSVNVLTQADQASPVDIIWLTVKCTGVEQACEDIKPFVSDNTVIFCCQNGLGSDHIVKQAFPVNTVLRVMVPFNVVDMAPGHFHRGSEGTLTIEHGDSHRVKELSTGLNSPIMPVTCTGDMQALLWAKLQLNLGNSINALADIPVKAMLEQRGYRKVIAAMMRELLAVTQAAGIQLPKVAALPGKLIPVVLELPDLLFRLVANKMLAIDPTVRTSMWWDLSNKKTTEIDHLNGAIVKKATELNVPTPVNDYIISRIKNMEKEIIQGNARKAVSADELLSEIGSIK